MERYQNLNKKNKEISNDKIKENVLREANTLEGWPEIKGYDFEGEFNFEDFMKSYLTTGFQATHLAQAIQIIKNMRKNNATIFFGFTSNMGSCGIRENIKYLVKYKLVHVLGSTVGAIEEDIIKCFKPFVMGDYRAVGKILREEGINRTGNIFIPNDRYIYFERFMNKFLDRLYQIQKTENRIIDIEEFVYEMGRELEIQNVENKEDSFVYWAYKNNIPFFCPALPDGSVGDMLYFFKKNNPDFKIDTSDYIVKLTDLAINCNKMGIIVIGGSVPKHMFANAGLFREGAEYTVYINTGLEMEGSNGGAPIDEAVSWGKIHPEGEKIKVEAEASLVFPLIVATAFKLYNPKKEK
jgi:deoxyhypusine synthase